MECSAVLVCGSSSEKGPLLADYDLIIIGGGPAGLTAGLYAARANMSAVLLEGKDTGGEILNTDLIEDYPGFASVTGAELAEKMAEHARKFGLKIETYARVKQVRVDGDRKIVELEDGTTHSAYAVIVTVGGEPVKLGVPERRSTTARASRTAPCATARSSRATISPSSAAATARSRRASSSRASRSKLHVVHRRSEFRAQAILQDRLLAKDMVHTVTPATVKEIGGDGTAVKWMDVARDGKVERIPVEGVFVFIGFKPVGKDLFADHIHHDENGYLITDQYMRRASPACMPRETRGRSSRSRSRPRSAMRRRRCCTPSATSRSSSTPSARSRRRRARSWPRPRTG